MDPRARLGASGEQAACELLRRAGYRILERNHRNRWGELDAVAWESGELVFVEVRSRSSAEFGTGAESVTAAKRRQLVRIARIYLQEHDLGEPPCRFDVVAMQARPDGGWQGEVLRGAFGVE